MTKQLRWLVVFLVTAIVGTATWLILQIRADIKVAKTELSTPPTIHIQLTKSPTPTATTEPTVTHAPTKNPKSLASIPFYSQAPKGIWDLDHEDACEEASMFMVHYWLKNERPSLTAYDTELLKLIRWQEARGYGISEGIEEMKQIAHDYFSMDTAIKTIENADQLRTILDAGTAIIFPADGRLLRNPNFRDGGPPFHVLVLKGYSDSYFTSNDPGTRNGESYKYHADVIMEALGNWNGSRVDRNDRRVLLVGA
jgi:hypothetical protein